MRTIYNYSRHYSRLFGRQLSRQQETVLVFMVPLVAVVLYALWGATLLH